MAAALAAFVEVEGCGPSWRNSGANQTRALSNQTRAIPIKHLLPNQTRALPNHTRALSTRRGLLPAVGTIPDMTAHTATYVALQARHYYTFTRLLDYYNVRLLDY